MRECMMEAGHSGISLAETCRPALPFCRANPAPSRIGLRSQYHSANIAQPRLRQQQSIRVRASNDEPEQSKISVKQATLCWKGCPFSRFIRCIFDESRPIRNCKIPGFGAVQEFGYSRKDVLLISAAFIGLGYALYYGLQAFGLPATDAGNYAQIVIFLIICVGYVSTYILRVANKDMTYTKQLEQYEQRVMQKRLEEMPETERERLMDEVDKERERRGVKS